MRAFLVPLMTVLLLLTSLAPARAASPPAPPQDEKVPIDPALVVGTLPNGLNYIIRQHKNPEGRVSIWLHVHTGSFNETESTRGLAHYLEHMAFNGTANFPPGSVIPFFQSLGLSFGRDQNAFTGFDQTTYQLILPSGSRESLEKGMLYMSDVALRMSLFPAEVDSEPTIKSVMPDDFREYYTRWYVPSNMTVLVVGDTNPAMVADVIEKEFGSGPTVPKPTPRDVGVKPTVGQRAIVVTDPELTRSEVSMARLEPPLGPALTVAQKRRELVESIGTWAFKRRMSAEIAAGRAAFLDADASIQEWAGTLRMFTVEASGRPGTWRAMLKQLGTELQRARLYGFNERELQDARIALIADAEEGVRREATRPAREVMRQLNGDVTRGSRPMSAAQTLALYQRLIPGITVREVSEAFRVNFDPSRTMSIAELPASDAPPSEAEFLALSR